MAIVSPSTAEIVSGNVQSTPIDELWNKQDEPTPTSKEVYG